MSGHSKWANIKHKKEKQDTKRAKIFTKIIKEISTSIKIGGADFENNSRLKLALQNAKNNNMPNDNIKKIIQKVSGESTIKFFEELIYEGYGLGGTAILIDVITDNRNRIAAEIRYIFDKCGGRMCESGSVSWMFEKKGKIIILLDKERHDEIILKLIEFGAEDIEIEDNEIAILTNTDKFDFLIEKIKDINLEIKITSIIQFSKNKIEIKDRNQEKQLIKMIELFERNEDIQYIYTNFKFLNKNNGGN